MNTFENLLDVVKPNFNTFIKNTLIKYRVEEEEENEIDENTKNHLISYIPKEYENKSIEDMLLEFTYIFNIGLYVIPFDEIEKTFSKFYPNWNLQPLKEHLTTYQNPNISIKNCLVIDLENIQNNSEIFDLFCDVVEHYLF